MKALRFEDKYRTLNSTAVASENRDLCLDVDAQPLHAATAASYLNYLQLAYRNKITDSCHLLREVQLLDFPPNKPYEG